MKRLFNFMMNFFKHPIDFIRLKWPFRWAERTSILLAMQTLENYIKLVPKKLGPFSWMTSRMEKGKEIPTYIPIANEVTRRFAEKINGMPQSSINEVMLNAPVTAHILGGAPMGKTREEGVIDPFNRIHGYKDLYICDGSMVPGNLGVNPSLTIMAMTEHAMSHIPGKENEETNIEKEKDETPIVMV